jgi:hypothetical protein
MKILVLDFPEPRSRAGLSFSHKIDNRLDSDASDANDCVKRSHLWSVASAPTPGVVQFLQLWTRFVLSKKSVRDAHAKPTMQKDSKSKKPYWKPAFGYERVFGHASALLRGCKEATP